MSPIVAALLVAVIAVGGGLVALLLVPAAATIHLAVDRANAQLAFVSDCERIGRPIERSTIYASDGETVLATVYLVNRDVVALEDVSEWARGAVLAAEDDSFYEHGGLSVPSVLRALIANVASGEIVQGGSTITQQLVKLHGDDTSQTIERKVREAICAARLEQRFSKDEIFERYLNDVFFGNNAYGIGTAADVYFGKPASNLTVGEAALLAGLIRAPSDYDPFSHPLRAQARRDIVLSRMVEEGMITEARAGKAAAVPVEDLLAGRRRAGPVERRPFFVDHLIDQIEQGEEFRALGETPKQRERTLESGGLEIVTTLDADWQRYAQEAADQPWSIPVGNRDHEEVPEVAIVSVDTETGAIRTMLSGRDGEETNVVTAARQPGSAFKPFTLVAAFRQDVPPRSHYDSRSPFVTDAWDNDCGCVHNAEGRSDRGYIDLWEATADSVNVVFARLILQIGAEPVARATEDLIGNARDIAAHPSMTLGTEEMSPLEMASAYAALANDGVRCEPYAVERITGPQGVLYRHDEDCEQVVRPEVARLVTAMLRGVVDHGTGTAARLPGRPIAGKTGTTQDYSNAWFVGYSRQVSTAVWVGFPLTTHSLELYFGREVFGGSVAAPIWRAFMTKAVAGMPVRGFPAPPPPESGEVPRVIGATSRAAQAELVAARFTVRVHRVRSLEPPGTVVDQEPRGGAIVELGSLVTLSVSSGRAPSVEVPGVVGLPQEDAVVLLAAAGFAVEVVAEPVEDPELDGVVLSQAPRAGREAPEGSAVTIAVGDVGGTAYADRRASTFSFRTFPSTRPLALPIA